MAKRMASQKEQLEELLASYVDGTLSEIDRRAVESYLDGHPDLRRDINEAIADSRALQSMPHVSAPAGLIDSMQQHVEREALLGDAKSSSGTGRNYALPKFAIAAMLLTGLGVGYFVFDKFYSQPGAKPVAIEAPKEEIVTSSRGELTDAAEPLPGLMRESAAEGFDNGLSDDSKLGVPVRSMRQRSLSFRNIAQTSDRDLMNIPQSQLTQDGRVLMKLNVNTEVVEAAEMSLNGFVTDNRLQLTSASFIGPGDVSNNEMTVSGSSLASRDDAKDQDTAGAGFGPMAAKENQWSQYGYFDKHKQSNQLRSLAMVRNIRVDQIDTLRQVVDRAPGSYPSTVVVIDNPESLEKRDGASTKPGSDWNEIERAAYRAQPGDRLRVQIDDPESQTKSEQILTVTSDGTLEEQNLNVKDKDVVSIETAIANQLQQAEKKSLPRVQVDPIEPMADSVELEPEQTVDLLVVIEGPAPLPPATAPALEAEMTGEITPSTQPSESESSPD